MGIPLPTSIFSTLLTSNTWNAFSHHLFGTKEKKWVDKQNNHSIQLNINKTHEHNCFNAFKYLNIKIILKYLFQFHFFRKST